MVSPSNDTVADGERVLSEMMMLVSSSTPSSSCMMVLMRPTMSCSVPVYVHVGSFTVSPATLYVE